MAPTLAGGAEPGRADRARPSPRTAQPGIFQSTAAQGRPGPRDSNLTDRLSGLAREMLRIFLPFLSRCVSSSSRFRDRNVLVMPRSVGSWVSRSLPTTGIVLRRRVCHAPIPAFGYHWLRVGYVVPWSGVLRATTKCHVPWLCLFGKKLGMLASS